MIEYKKWVRLKENQDWKNPEIEYEKQVKREKNREKQRKFRENAKNGRRRIEAYISTQLYLELEAMAERYHVTNTEMLESLIHEKALSIGAIKTYHDIGKVDHPKRKSSK